MVNSGKRIIVEPDIAWEENGHLFIHGNRLLAKFGLPDTKKNREWLTRLILEQTAENCPGVPVIIEVHHHRGK